MGAARGRNFRTPLIIGLFTSLTLLTACDPPVTCNKGDRPKGLGSFPISLPQGKGESTIVDFKPEVEFKGDLKVVSASTGNPYIKVKPLPGGKVELTNTIGHLEDNVTRLNFTLKDKCGTTEGTEPVMTGSLAESVKAGLKATSELLSKFSYNTPASVDAQVGTRPDRPVSSTGEEVEGASGGGSADSDDGTPHRRFQYGYNEGESSEP